MRLEVIAKPAGQDRIVLREAGEAPLALPHRLHGDQHSCHVDSSASMPAGLYGGLAVGLVEVLQSRPVLL